MKILITGATGLIGTALVNKLLKAGHQVNYLTTSKDKIQDSDQLRGFLWNPSHGFIDNGALIGVDAIIHLAGASIAKRWTKAYKQEIIESRIFSANLLFKILKNNPHQVRRVISASGVGIYPDSISEVYTEDSTASDNSFLHHVVTKWEESVLKFQMLGVDVCILRTGVVFSDKGGALPQMVKPIRTGFGSAIGSGKQVISWIHLDDLVEMYHFALENSLSGIYNAVAPNPVSNEQFTKIAATLLNKPLFMPNVPEFAIRLLLGEMHQLVVAGQLVSSRKIEDAGFVFRFPEAENALRSVIN